MSRTGYHTPDVAPWTFLPLVPFTVRWYGSPGPEGTTPQNLSSSARVKSVEKLPESLSRSLLSMHGSYGSHSNGHGAVEIKALAGFNKWQEEREIDGFAIVDACQSLFFPASLEMNVPTRAHGLYDRIRQNARDVAERFGFGSLEASVAEDVIYCVDMAAEWINVHLGELQLDKQQGGRAALSTTEAKWLDWASIPRPSGMDVQGQPQGTGLFTAQDREFFASLLLRGQQAPAPLVDTGALPASVEEVIARRVDQMVAERLAQAASPAKTRKRRSLGDGAVTPSADSSASPPDDASLVPEDVFA